MRRRNAEGQISRRSLSKGAILCIILGIGAIAVIGALIEGNEASSIRHRSLDPAQASKSLWDMLSQRGSNLRPGRRVSSPSFTSKFPIFEGPQKAMPASLAKKVSKTLGAPRHPFSYSVYLPTAMGGLWVEATETVICLVESLGAVTCATAPAVAAKGLGIGTARPSRKGLEYQLLGVVPAGIHSIEVMVGNQLRRVGIQNMAYAMRAKKRIVVTSFVRSFNG